MPTDLLPQNTARRRRQRRAGTGEPGSTAPLQEPQHSEPADLAPEPTEDFDPGLTRPQHALDFDDASELPSAPEQPDRATPGPRRLPAAVDEDQLAAWIARVVVHDEAGLAALYDHTAHRVHSLVLRITRNQALAEEVVEDTYFQVWRQAARFDPARGRAMTWLLAMARSRAIDTLRREARNQHQSTAEAAEAGAEAAWGEPSAAADDLLAVARSHAELHRAMMLLHAQPRQLVALAFMRGLSHEEIANTTALPLGTVKSQIRRALGTLKQLLGENPLPAPVR